MTGKGTKEQSSIVRRVDKLGMSWRAILSSVGTIFFLIKGGISLHSHHDVVGAIELFWGLLVPVFCASKLLISKWR